MVPRLARQGRQLRLDLAWMSIEPNTFGTNEFMTRCCLAGTEPMMAANLGRRGADAARRLVEHCSHPGGTNLSAHRREHGWQEPYGVKF